MGLGLQDPNIQMPDLQRELGAALYNDLTTFLQRPYSEEGEKILWALPQRLQAPPQPGAGAARPVLQRLAQ